MSFEQEVELAKLVAQEAGALALDYARKGVSAETKADESPVTAADRACEKLIVETISRDFPDDGFLGEEGASRDGRSGRRWIIDPIDGTRDFVRGIPLWAILIGLEVNGHVVAGAAHSPGQNLLLSAARDLGAWANGQRIKVSDKARPEDAVLSFNGFNKLGVRRFKQSLMSWIEPFWAVRSMGGAIDACLVVQGKSDVWIEPDAKAWDLAPFQILIEEAGGIFRSFSGKNTIHEGNAYACTPGLEPYIKELLKASE